MLITLMLWQSGAISAPHFYISRFFDQNKDAYIDHMRAVSVTRNWTPWVVFFLEGIKARAALSLDTAERIQGLYEDLKEEFIQTLNSTWSVKALDFLFASPVFFNPTFLAKSGIPIATAHRISKQLVERDVVTVLQKASGRRPALFAFEQLLKIVRG